jgi:predicted unusual protein kinase regulating ubiquinone biosynthesis (AarF/ABC1/UbiB family)
VNAIKRTLKLAGLSALSAGSKIIKNKSLQEAMRRSMAGKMADMKGIPAKVSQILGMKENDLAQIHQQALAEIEPMSETEVRDILQLVSPEFCDEATFEKDVKCASLGQVCRMNYKDGDYAVKVQYTDSESNLNLDSSAFKLITGVFGNFKKGFQLKEYNEMMRQELLLELDYNRELKMQHEFFSVFSNNPDIVIPLPFSKYSSKSCLVMSWEQSLPLSDFIKIATKEQKSAASRLMVEFYFESAFNKGFLHADPNPGNFGFRIQNEKVQLVVYDFGSVVKLSKEKHLNLLTMFQLCMDNKNPYPALVKAGFDQVIMQDIKNKLPALMMVLLAPFFSEQRFNFSTWNRKERTKDVLGEQRWNFMMAAPADLFLFMRCLQGIFYYTDKLSSDIYCLPKLQDVLSSHAVDICETINSFAGEENIPLEEALSENMIISVKENGRQKVKLTLPARAIENLQKFIPPDIIEKLEQEKIDILQLVKQVRQNSYKPQDIFTLKDDPKEIKVYLI